MQGTRYLWVPFLIDASACMKLGSIKTYVLSFILAVTVSSDSFAAACNGRRWLPPTVFVVSLMLFTGNWMCVSYNALDLVYHSHNSIRLCSMIPGGALVRLVWHGIAALSNWCMVSGALDDMRQLS
jgi:hypothetical protein